MVTSSRRPTPTFVTLATGLKLHYHGAPSAIDERSEEGAEGQRGALSDLGVVRAHGTLGGWS